MERSTTGDNLRSDDQPKIGEPRLTDPADKTQPAEGGEDEATDGATEPDTEDAGTYRPTGNDG
jgi:hypothetical protein